MRYTSSLHAPDLRPFFKLANPMIQKLGHDCPSDPDFEPGCTFLTDDEAAILFHIAKAWPKRWVDIGARFGWSTAHIAAAGVDGVTPVDPELANYAAMARFESNVIEGFVDDLYEVCAITSEQFFARERNVDAAMIDGNHDAPEPTVDAMRAFQAGAQVFVFHDFAGKPIRDAVRWLMGGVLDETPDGGSSILSNGFYKVRIYWTPNLMAVAWRDGCGFVPPDHVRDPRVDWGGMERIVAEDFDVRRTV